MDLTTAQPDRACGVLLATAAGTRSAPATDPARAFRAVLRRGAPRLTPGWPHVGQ
jgi:hypothetical protein